jgi:hypothetical protein
MRRLAAEEMLSQLVVGFRCVTSPVQMLERILRIAEQIFVKYVETF